jgi:hypothetical protein
MKKDRNRKWGLELISWYFRAGTTVKISIPLASGHKAKLSK